ncbi:MAG TPA: GNAT family N-acetyltransferase [Chthonomonadales bacterium]|nr:GNAT family N-acetyltransferase [Chthonomonadales bacterium]
MTITIRAASTDADRHACYALRICVFVEEQAVPVEEEMDHYDADAAHFVVEADGRVVGTARLVHLGDGCAKVGRVAILPEYRGRGIGHALMHHVMEAGLRNCSTLVLDAQVDVIGFYERLGFEAEGPVFLDAGIDHRRMRMER